MISYSDIYRCEICDRVTRDTSKLCGGFQARLCNKHINAWHKHIMVKDVWAEYKISTAWLKYAEYNEDIDEIIHHGKRTSLIARRLFRAAEKWFATEKAKTEGAPHETTQG